MLLVVSLDEHRSTSDHQIANDLFTTQLSAGSDCAVGVSPVSIVKFDCVVVTFLFPGM